MSQKEGTIALHSLAELGSLSGVNNQHQDADFYSESFSGLPLDEQLWQAYLLRGKQDEASKSMRKIATLTALKNPKLRTTQEINTTAYVPLNAQGNMDCGYIFDYLIYTVFPRANRRHYINASRTSLQSVFVGADRAVSPDKLAEIDKLVTNQVELRQETLPDQYTRTIHEVKFVDTLIKSEKELVEDTSGHQARKFKIPNNTRQTTSHLELLNNIKHEWILSYLNLAGDLMQAFPNLRPPFDLSDGMDTFHRRLTMHSPSEPKIIQRLINPETQPELIDGNFSLSTGINTDLLRKTRDRDQLPEDKTAAQICEILRL